MNKEGMTVSEELFERFCAENEVSYSPIPRATDEGIKTPDFEILINARRIIVEVKQLDPESPDDKKYQKQLDELGITDVHENKVTQRIRGKISDAMPQLNRWANKETPGLLFLYSNLPLDGRYIQPRYILEAMYGEETLEIVLPNNRTIQPHISNVRFGGKRKVTSQYNTSLSAIVNLFEDWEHREIHAHFYNNVFSICKFHPEWFRRNRVKHFSLPNEDMRQFSDWVEV